VRGRGGHTPPRPRGQLGPRWPPGHCRCRRPPSRDRPAL